jgi:predicted nucleotidyltransferase
MGLLSEAVKNKIQPFITDIQLLFGDHTVSLIVYGSAATEEYVSKKSDINVLVVLDDEGIQNLLPVQKKITRWQKQGVRPLFLTESYIDRSLDSFPIEFLNMQSAYHVVTGKDVLTSLDIARQDLRLQCERELKGKLLHLRQGFVMTRGQKGALKTLIKESVGAFTAIFRVLLHLKGKDIPAARQDVIQQTCKIFDLDEDLFSTLFAIRQDATKPSQSELEKIVASYIQQIDTLSNQVDEM